MKPILIHFLDRHKFFLMLILMPVVMWSQEQLNVQGDAKIRGHLDINASEDTSSIFIGRNAVPINVSNGRNTFVGVNAGGNEDDPSDNAFFGFHAGRNNSGNGNSFFGSTSGVDNNGSDNAFFGNRAGMKNNGTSNAFFGFGAGEKNDNSLNAFFGYESGKLNTNGEENAFFGAESGPANSTGNKNTFLGYFSGSGIKEGSDNTFVGAYAGALEDTTSYGIAIGSFSKVGCDNCAVIGGINEKAVKVGIGVQSPTAHIEVYGASGTPTPHVLLHESTGTFARLRYKNTTNPNTYWDVAGRSASPGSAATAELNFFYNDGSINVLKLFGDGDATLAGNLTENSDQRLKKNIQPLQGVLDQLLVLGAYSYEWKDRASGQKYIGLLAQEVQKSFPELVRKNEQGILSVSYTHFVPLLIEGIKEQQTRIDAQQELLSRQQAQIQALQKQVQYLMDSENQKE